MMDQVPWNLYTRSDNELNLYVQRMFHLLPQILPSIHTASVTNAPQKNRISKKTTLFKICTLYSYIFRFVLNHQIFVQNL